jgi:hypothetical protein
MLWGPPTGARYWPPPPRHWTPFSQLGLEQWTSQLPWGPSAGGSSMPWGMASMPWGPSAAGGPGQA